MDVVFHEKLSAVIVELAKVLYEGMDNIPP
jgi:hypothetical protein